MSVQRKKPEIGKTDSSSKMKSNETGSCCWFPVIILISYVVLSAIARVDMKIGSKLDYIICYGALIGFVILMVWGALDLLMKENSRMKDRKKWTAGCKTALLKIVNRSGSSTSYDDYTNTSHHFPCTLELEMSSDQKDAAQNQTTVRVEVRQYVYDRLMKCDTVRIYYPAQEPLTFLLEEEI
jgi:hypothetical protein